MFQITDVYKTVSTLARKFTFGKLPDIHHKLLLLHQLQILYFTHTLISIISSPVFILHSSDLSIIVITREKLLGWYKSRGKVVLKTFIHRKYTVNIDRIQICTKDKNRTIIRNIHYNLAVARFLTTTL